MAWLTLVRKRKLVRLVIRLGQRTERMEGQVEPGNGTAASTGNTAVSRSEGRWAGQATSHERRWGWAHGQVIAAFAVLTAGLLVLHQMVPNFAHLGSLLKAFLPWLGLVVLVLFGLALLRRSATALVALLLPVAAWTYLFGGLFMPAAEPNPHDLVVVQHNVSDENTALHGS
jgi:vancomycin resistance protein VanJ